MKNILFMFLLLGFGLWCRAQAPQVTLSGKTGGIITAEVLKNSKLMVSGGKGIVTRFDFCVQSGGFTECARSVGGRFTQRQIELFDKAQPGKIYIDDIEVLLDDSSKIDIEQGLVFLKDGPCVDLLRTGKSSGTLRQRLLAHPRVFVYPSYTSTDTGAWQIASFTLYGWSGHDSEIHLQAHGPALTPKMTALLCKKTKYQFYITNVRIVGADDESFHIGELFIPAE